MTRRRAGIGARRDVAALFLIAHAPGQHGEQRDPPDQEVDRDCGADADHRSGLLKLDQSAAEILRMQEQHRLAVRAYLRLAVAEDARTVALERVARGFDVGYLVADMMDAAVRIFVEEFGDGRILAERL